MTTTKKELLLRRAVDCRVSRISPADTNKFAMLVDPLADRTPFVSAVEIFEVGGRTPPHFHATAHEMFYVLSGTGRCRCDDGSVHEIAQGDTLVLPPGREHVIENTGAERLYCLTVMVPNEGFAEMIRNGQPMALDQTDRAVIAGSGTPRPSPSGSSPARPA
ncbi:MAG: cupin domain-containing protein [Reyranella sp.]|uniref:cupin domain-containing protein n=1 Tax=Reyranella sp. TaxID=1929291 RepID=UPI0012259CAB|nr:cupin domain-containing protein [Reyranella sp.]TAJ97720.1 MAG: cupin domain-containing protein [Reyranella sp.]TBR27886.1 MAG: cupin domain-containing protein [Reyranella sp.]